MTVQQMGELSTLTVNNRADPISYPMTLAIDQCRDMFSAQRWALEVGGRSVVGQRDYDFSVGLVINR